MYKNPSDELCGTQPFSTKWRCPIAIVSQAASSNMKFIALSVLSLFAVLGLIEAMGYGYQQSYYPVPMPYLAGGQRRGDDGGFLALIGLLVIIVALFGFNRNTNSSPSTSIINLDDDRK